MVSFVVVEFIGSDTVEVVPNKWLDQSDPLVNNSLISPKTFLAPSGSSLTR